AHLRRASESSEAAAAYDVRDGGIDVNAARIAEGAFDVADRDDFDAALHEELRRVRTDVAESLDRGRRSFELDSVLGRGFLHADDQAARRRALPPGRAAGGHRPTRG